MRVTHFSEEVARREGKKKELSIAQIKEVLKVINELLSGELYTAIRKLEKFPWQYRSQFSDSSTN